MVKHFLKLKIKSENEISYCNPRLPSSTFPITDLSIPTYYALKYIERLKFQGDDELSNPYDAAMEALKAEHKNETQRLQDQVSKYKEQVDESEKERKELKSQNKDRKNKIKELESRIKDMQSAAPPTQIVVAAAPTVAASEETTTETGALFVGVCVCVFECVCVCLCV